MAEAKTEFAKYAIDYFRELEKKGFGKKDFGFVFQYIHKNFDL